jgi:hypothetical protein
MHPTPTPLPTVNAALLLFSPLALLGACVVGPDAAEQEDIDTEGETGILGVDTSWKEHWFQRSTCDGRAGAEYVAIEIVNECDWYPTLFELVVRKADGSHETKRDLVMNNSSFEVEYDDDRYASFEVGTEKRLIDCLHIEHESACIDTVAVETLESQHLLAARRGGSWGVDAGGVSLGDSEVFELVDFGDIDGSGHRTVSLRASSGRWVVAEDGGGGDVLADRENRSTWETFYAIDRPDGITAFETWDGSYLRAWYGGGSRLDAKAEQIGPWEEFRVLPVDVL